VAGLYKVTVADRVHPWPVVFEIAEHTDIDNWTLVGGLMVHVHAIRAGVDAARPTGDVDVVFSAATAKVSAIAAPLQTLGFTPKLPELGGPLHRFTRGDDIVDIMVPSGVTARWSQRPILQAPGARQALQRRDTYIIVGATRQVRVTVPNQLGSLIAKGAAYNVDRRDRDRHLDDLAVLAACAGSIKSLHLNELTSRDRAHLRAATELLTRSTHPAWAQLSTIDRQLGQRVLAALHQAAHV
jgi:hypothetical protein